MLQGHGNGPIVGLAFTADDARIASWSPNDNVIIIWDVDTGSAVLRLEGHEHVEVATLSPDNSTLTSVSFRSICVWNLVDGSCIVRVDHSAGTTRKIKLSSDGTKVAMVLDEGVFIWNRPAGAASFERKRLLTQIRDAIVAFSPDGTKIATGSTQYHVVVWDVATGSPIWGDPSLSGIKYIAYSRDGTKLAAGAVYRQGITIRIWETVTGSAIFNGGYRDNPRYHVGRVAFSQDSHMLMAETYRELYVWDILQKVQLFRLNKKRPGHEMEFVFSPNGTTFAKRTGKMIELRSMATGALISKLQGHTDDVWTVAYSRDGTRIASGSYRGSIGMWNAADASASQLPYQEDQVVSIAFSPDGERVASGSHNTSVRLWDAGTGALQWELRGHLEAVEVVCFSPDSTKLASGSGDEVVILWDVSTGHAVLHLKKRLSDDDENTALVVAFSPDGAKLALGRGPRVRIWSTVTGDLIYKYDEPRQWSLAGMSALDRLSCFAFSPDGNHLAIEWRYGGIRIGDVVSQSIVNLEEHDTFSRMCTFPAQALMYSQDGTKLLLRRKKRKFYEMDLRNRTLTPQP